MNRKILLSQWRLHGILKRDHTDTIGFKQQKVDVWMESTDGKPDDK